METNLMNEETKTKVFNTIENLDYLPSILTTLSEISIELSFNKDLITINRDHINLLMSWYNLIDILIEVKKGEQYDMDEYIINVVSNLINNTKLLLEIQKGMLRLEQNQIENVLDSNHFNLIETMTEIYNYLIDLQIKQAA